MNSQLLNQWKKYIPVTLICFLFPACTTLNFEDEDESPVIVLENAKDTITIGDDYTPQYSVTDNEDSQQSLLENIEIWVEDANGTELDLETFTESSGIYYIYLKVTDSDGNTSEIVQLEVLVSEDDKTPPVITVFGPNPLIINLGDTYHEPGVKAVDNFDGDVSDKVEFGGEVDIYSEDDYTLTYSVEDKAGNAASAQRIVTVKDSDGSDKEKPVITLLGDNPYILLVGQTYEDPGATATDNVDGTISYKILKYDTLITAVQPDTHLVYYTVEDAAGNVAMAIRTVYIETSHDTIPPVITLLGDNPMYLEFLEKYTEPGAEAEDNNDGDISDKIVIDDNEVDIYQNGKYTVYYSVSDAAGNYAEEERVVFVGIIDSVPPEITVVGPNPMLIDYKGIYSEPGAYAMDNVDDSIPFSKFSVEKDINFDVLGTYTVTYFVSDAAGNESSAEREVEVADTIAPKITLNGPNPVNLGLGFPYTEFGVKEAIDNYDGDLTDQVDTGGTVNSSVGGTYIITYRVSDSNGNEAVVEREVHVAKDTDPPIITLKGDNPMDLYLGEPYVEPGATAYDSVDGDLTDKIDIDGTVNSDVAGTYTVTYTVSDTGGNVATAERRVVVAEDDEPPVITLKGQNPMPLLVGDTYNEPGATAVDNVDGDLTGQIDIDNSDVNTSSAGTYEVLYSVSDNSGNKAEKIRTVIVSTDNTPPTLTLKGRNPMSLKVGQDYVEPGATAVDDVDGDITDKIEITGTVNTDSAGTYTVTYSVSDNAGNETVKTRTVHVTEQTAIVIEKDKVYTFDEATLFTLSESDLPSQGSQSYSYSLYIYFNSSSSAFEIKVDINGTVSETSGATWDFGNVKGPSPQAVGGEYNILITPVGKVSIKVYMIEFRQ